MQKVFIHYITRVFILCIGVICISSATFAFVAPDSYFILFPIIVLIFPIVSSAIHYQLLKSSQKSPARFNVAFMSAFMVKLFIYGGLTATLLYFEPDSRKEVVVSVLLMYAIYTIFETRQVLADIKTLHQKKDPRDKPENPLLES
jgi:hypothetical protein